MNGKCSLFNNSIQEFCRTKLNQDKNKQLTLCLKMWFFFFLKDLGYIIQEYLSDFNTKLINLL